MTKHYLDLDYKTTCFYEYSKTAREGFEEHTNNAGTVSYRKLYTKGVFGTLQSISLYDTERQGKELQIRLLLGEDVFICKLPLNDQRGQFDNRFIEPIITMLPNLVKDQAYRIYPWSMESETVKLRNGKFKTYYGVSIKKANLDTQTVTKGDEDKVFPKFVYCKKDETFDALKHLPKLEFVEELGAMKPTAVSVDAKRSFLVRLLEQGLKDLGYVANNEPQPKPQTDTNTSNTPATPVTVATAKDIAAPTEDLEEDYDDLPF